MNVLFLGAPIAPPVSVGLTLEQRFQLMGQNTGNLLIGQSIFEELIVKDYGYGTHYSAREAEEKFDVIVIAAANFIFKGFDLSSLANYIEPIKLPCVMVGLGAQAPKMGHKLTDIPEGTRRLLSLVSDRGKMIGVRGEYTAETMNDLGYKNVAPVGCPSLYRTLKKKLTIRRPVIAEDMKVSLNGSRNVYSHSATPMSALQIEGELLKLSIEKGWNYVLQNEEPELYISQGDALSDPYLLDLTTLIKRFNLTTTPEIFAQHMREKYQVFFDLMSWDNYIRTFDASIGSRFHGNMIALTNEVPAVILTHDSRTTEMAELMQIPHIAVDRISALDVLETFKSADFDGFETRYSELFESFADFLFKNGLDHKLDAASKPRA